MLELLAKLLPETQTACYTWVFIGMEPREIFSKGKQQRKVKARSLFCFWAVSELGMSLRELARRLEMSSPGVGFSVERGETIARENGLQLIE